MYIETGELKEKKTRYSKKCIIDAKKQYLNAFKYFVFARVQRHCFSRKRPVRDERANVSSPEF